MATTKPRPSRRARGSLSREEILDCAQRLVEDGGLPALSMPAVAKQLKSGVTSIYWYFRNKDDLLQALVDRVTREIHEHLPPVGDRRWDEELMDYFAAYRMVLERTPIYIEVFAYRSRFLFLRSAMAPTMIRRLEEGLELLTRAGLTAEEAVRAFNVLTIYTNSFVMLEHSAESDPAEVDRDGAANFRLDPALFPLLAQFDTVDEATRLDDEQFLLGLRLVIDGLRREFKVLNGTGARRTRARSA